MLELFTTLFDLLVSSIDFLGSSFINGIQFFLSLFINIPNFLLDLFGELPEFMQIGLSGAFGFICLVVFLKILALLKLS